MIARFYFWKIERRNLDYEFCPFYYKILHHSKPQKQATSKVKLASNNNKLITKKHLIQSQTLESSSL